LSSVTLAEGARAPVIEGWPAITKMSQSKLSAVASPPASFQRRMWPQTLLARGLASSTGGRAEPAEVLPSAALDVVPPRRLLLVSVT
jgi:hypothetical protein